MVSKSTSILLAVAVVAVSAVAIIGLGYAYTASTENAGNEVASSYLTVTQTSYTDGFEDNSVVFNTTNPNGTITYTLEGTVENATGNPVAGIELASAPTGTYYAAGTGGDKIYKLGDSAFTLTKYGMSTIPAYNLTISATGLDTTHYKYYISIGNTAQYYVFTGADLTIAQAAGGAGPVNFTINVFIAEGATAPDSASYKPLTDSTFTITAEV